MRCTSQTALRAAPAVAALTLWALPLNSPAQTNAVPSYATREESISGTISGFNGSRTVFVRDDRGFVDNVTLRDGTIINPTGLRLAAGQRVTILGFAQGSTFVANEIDTPYAMLPPPYGSYPVVPPPMWYYAPPLYYPYYYGYGPSLRVGIVFSPHYYGPRYYGGRYYGGHYYGPHYYAPRSGSRAPSAHSRSAGRP